MDVRRAQAKPMPTNLHSANEIASFFIWACGASGRPKKPLKYA
jgi:hypothetical protein